MNAAIQLAPAQHDMIRPQWWRGAPYNSPSDYQIDCSEYDMGPECFEAGSELALRIEDTFDRIGLVHLINTGLTDLQLQRQLAMFAIKKAVKYEGGSNSRSPIQPNVYEIGAPLTAHLHYHHEMAYIGASTTALGFLCQHAPEGKGATFVSDNLAATDAILATEFGQKLKRLGLCYHRDLTDREAYVGTEELGVYNHWQKSMMTDCPEQAIEFARARGLECEWGPNRLLKTRYYISAFEYCPFSKRNVLFSSVADDGIWFDEWPKVKHLPNNERPLKLTFGDGTEMTHEEKKLFVDIYDRFGSPIEWRPGDVAAVCNYRFAHGRPGIDLASDEKRQLGVIIGEHFTRVGDLPGKW